MTDTIDTTDPAEPRGIGGWLGLFVAIIAVISPIRIVVESAINLYGEPETAAAFGDRWPSIQLAAWSTTAIALLGTSFLAWRLIRVRNWQTVRLVIAGIWLLGIVTPIIDFGTVAWITGFPFSELAGELGPELVRPIIFCSVWTAYLLASKRVRNTYPRVAEGSEAARIFS